MVFDKGGEPSVVRTNPFSELVNHLDGKEPTGDWVGSAARDAYPKGSQLALDNGARVEVGPDGLPKITVTPGLILQMGPLGKGLKPGDQIIVAPTPPKA